MIDLAVYGLLPTLAATPAADSADWHSALCRALTAGAATPPSSVVERRAALLRARGLVDVTVTLQSLVVKGTLALPAGTRASARLRARSDSSAD